MRSAHPGLLDRRDRVAAADNRRALHLRDGLGDAIVPLANASISNTPMGPFQTTVFASASAFAYAATVFGPMSSPIRSPIAVSSTLSVSDGAPASSFGATT